MNANFASAESRNSISASAAAEFSAPLPTGAYISAGFALFVLTFIVNALARTIAGGKVNG